MGALHAAAYNACNDTELVALCDKDPVTLEQAGRDFGVERLYADFEDMLHTEQLDLLSIATAQQLHAEMTIQSARYNPRAILCEKPMASSMGEACTMLEACKRNDVRLAIGHEWRWMDLHVKARSLIAEAAIGEPLFAYIGVDPGGLMNRGTDQINYTLFVLGDPKAKWVLANVQRDTDHYERGTICEDLCMGIASVGDGTRIAIDCDIGHVGPLQDRSFVIAGENGMISIEPRPAQGVAAHSLTVVSSTGKSFEVGPGDLPEVNADVEQMDEMAA